MKQTLIFLTAISALAFGLIEIQFLRLADAGPVDDAEPAIVQAMDQDGQGSFDALVRAVQGSSLSGPEKLEILGAYVTELGLDITVGLPPEVDPKDVADLEANLSRMYVNADELMANILANGIPIPLPEE